MEFAKKDDACHYDDEDHKNSEECPKSAGLHVFITTSYRVIGKHAPIHTQLVNKDLQT